MPITRNNVLRRAAEPRLEMLRLRTSIWPDWQGGASMPAKATKAFLEWNRRTSPISAISCGPRAGPIPNIPITTGYSGKEAAKECISCFNEANATEVVWSCATACCTKSLVVSFRGITPMQLRAFVCSSTAFSWLKL